MSLDLRQFPARRAFTLVELVVVIAIIAVLAAMTVPAIRSLTQDNAKAQAAAQIRAALSEARGIALARGAQAGVVFFQETAAHSAPVHGDQIALQIFIAEPDQTTATPMNPKNTLFVPYSTARAYLPAGVAVAALNDAANKGVINGDSTGGHSLAVLFDPSGRMLTRHGLARRNLSGPSTPGTYPEAMLDWNFASQGTPNSDNSSDGISSPGIFLYDQKEYAAAATASDAARDTWVKRHATAIIINANTGALLP
jgi:prepilin-type N-terminal cleavage/methylation domain-containing protein